MSFGTIWKETGRATHDEIRRIRQRLEILEGYRGSLTQALIRSGTDDGPVGTDDIFLRLDCANDPLTGNLQGLHSRWTRVGIGTDPSFPFHVVEASGATPLAKWSQAGAVDSLLPSDASIVGDLQIWMKTENLPALSDGDNVLSWPNDASAQVVTTWSNGGAGPIYRTGEINSRPSVNVEASGEYLVQGNQFSFGQSTIFAVYRTPDGAGDGAQALTGNDGGTAKEGFRIPGQGDKAYYIFENSVWQRISEQPVTGDVTASTFYIGVWTRNSSDEFGAYHATAAQALTNVTTLTAAVDSDAITIDLFFRDRNSGGTTGVNNGTGFAEFVAFDTLLTDAQITQVYNYLADRFNFPLIGSPAGDYLHCVDGSDNIKFLITKDGAAGVGTNTVNGKELYVAGDAEITGQILAATAQVTGTTTLSATVIQATASVAVLLTVAGIEGSGRVTISNDITIPTAHGLYLSHATSGRVSLAGTSKVWFDQGGGNSQMYHDGTHLVIRPRNGGAENLRIYDGALTDYVQVNGANAAITIASNQPTLGWQELDTTWSSWTVFLASDQLRLSDGSSAQIVQFYNDNTAGNFKFRTGDLQFDQDSVGVLFGEGQDARIAYNGTDLVLDPKVVGSGEARVDGNLNVVGRAKGIPVLLQFGDASISGTQYLNGPGPAPTSSAGGHVSMHVGSATGLSFAVSGSVISTPGVLMMTLRKNGTSFATLSATISGDTAVYATIARSVSTFTAGDILSLHAAFDGSLAGTFDMSGSTELTQDT